MMEAGVLIDLDGKPIFWHLPKNRSIGALPDSRDLWEVIWENRDRVLGFAHSHPGSGKPGPSYEDVTTFAAVEAALGRRLDWWITSFDEMILVRHAGPGKLDYVGEDMKSTTEWVDSLREHSGYGVQRG